MRFCTPQLLILILFSWSAIQVQAADPTLQWSVFRPGDSFSTITISPRGKVWVKQTQEPTAYWFDGYTNGALSLPETGNYRVHESRSSQLWTIAPNGLLLFEKGRWLTHEIVDVRNELMGNPLRQIRQISLLPLEINHVLLLLSDKLLLYEAVPRRVTILKLASQTGLGQFNEMRESADGGIWLSGMNGLAKIAGPLRNMGTNLSWTEYLLPPASPIQNLQVPWEGADGSVTTLGFNELDNGEKYKITFNGTLQAEPIQGERLRQLWTSWDQSIWAYNFNALYRRSGDLFVREGLLTANYDVHVETNGVFWIASSEGLIRYAPSIWRPPVKFAPLQVPVHAVLRSRTSRTFWIETAEGLVRDFNDQMDLVPWPADFELHPLGESRLFELPDGRLVIDTEDRTFQLRSDSWSFENLHPLLPGKIVGQAQDGQLFVSGAGTNATNLYLFDGNSLSPLTLEIPGGSEAIASIHFAGEMPNGDLWIAADNNLWHRRANSTMNRALPLERGLGEKIQWVVQMFGDRTWCASSDTLFELKGRSWEPIYSPGQRITGITKGEDGAVWLGTVGAVHRLQNGTWVSHSHEEGLTTRPVYSVYFDTEHGILAATAQGLLQFHSSADIDPPQSLPADVQTFRDGTEVITTAFFRGLDRWEYTPSTRLLYSWRLDEGGWSPFTNHQFRVFKDLGPGQHKIDIRAMDRSGNEDPLFATVTFSVVLPWFKDPRLVAVSLLGISLVLFFAGVAVNKHVQLKRSYAEVELKVRERTSQLEKAHQELLHSQKMSALGTLAAGIAHDFNNILSIIKGSVQVIESNPEDKEKIKTRVSRILTVVDQGSGIVKAMLGLGRVTEKDFIECNPGEIVEELGKIASDRYSNEVVIEIHSAPGLPRIICAREILQQMVLNLVMNAVDAIGGQGRVLLQTELLVNLPSDLILQPAPSASYIAVSVKDDGIGIPPQNIERIFEPFFTTKAFSSRRGTGLGLSMVYELAKQMGYGINLKTEVNKGSTFTILLPASKAH
ncbi:MAG: ATP-binding protein [Verrucomicrobiota bacterium]|nr:ATP-binding protein [Verrucomicrobiota bacterium]